MTRKNPNQTAHSNGTAQGTLRGVLSQVDASAIQGASIGARQVDPVAALRGARAESRAEGLVVRTQTQRMELEELHIPYRSMSSFDCTWSYKTLLKNAEDQDLLGQTGLEGMIDLPHVHMTHPCRYNSSSPVDGLRYVF